MKSEKEIVWLSKLYNSPACNDPLNYKLTKKSLCKKDFERLLDAPEKSKEFQEWFDILIEEGVIYYEGLISYSFNQRLNRDVKGYKVDLKSLVRYAKKNGHYKELLSFFSRDKVL